jgi:hypothetical protein
MTYQELSMVTTLYHKEVGAGFDKKEFRFQVEEVCAGKSNRIVANATVCCGFLPWHPAQ